MKELDKEKTLEKLKLIDPDIYLDEDDFFRDCLDDAIFNVEDAYTIDCIARNMTQGCSSNKGFVIGYLHQFVDEIFKVDLEKVIQNMEKLGLVGYIDGDGYYHVDNVGLIVEDRLPYVEQLKLIPEEKVEWSGEFVYNNVLKASKEWSHEQ